MEEKRTQVNFAKIMHITSLVVSGFYVFGYIFSKIFYECFLNRIFDNFSDQIFYVTFLSFIILCNISNLTGIIKSIVRDKVSEQTILEMIPNIKDRLKQDTNFVNELIESHNKKSDNKAKVKESDFKK